MMEHAKVLAGLAESKYFYLFMFYWMTFSSRNPARAVIVDVQNVRANGKMDVINIFLFSWRKLRTEGLHDSSLPILLG
jgi:hypothetical protein